jgi:NAD(P)-dependent dehydrogenase (short-subunit alcohol dehydrogenase family)
MSLMNKTIVVTGGSRGLGLGLVEALVDQGGKTDCVHGRSNTAAIPWPPPMHIVSSP